jgi:hypothetical protein
MEVEEGVCIENVRGWCEAIDKCRRTLPYEKWHMLRHELKVL